MDSLSAATAPYRMICHICVVGFRSVATLEFIAVLLPHFHPYTASAPNKPHRDLQHTEAGTLSKGKTTSICYVCLGGYLANHRVCGVEDTGVVNSHFTARLKFYIFFTSQGKEKRTAVKNKICALVETDIFFQTQTHTMHFVSARKK